MAAENYVLLFGLELKGPESGKGAAPPSPTGKLSEKPPPGGLEKGLLIDMLDGGRCGATTQNLVN